MSKDLTPVAGRRHAGMSEGQWEDIKLAVDFFRANGSYCSDEVDWEYQSEYYIHQQSLNHHGLLTMEGDLDELEVKRIYMERC